MRIHTSHLSTTDLDNAIRAAGLQPYNLTYSVHGSRKRHAAFEIRLTGTSNRRPNPGTGGRDVSGEHAATWDEWGIFLAHLFEIDPDMVTPYYADASDFHYRTGTRFDSLTPEAQHRSHVWTFAGPGARECACGASQRWI